MFGPINFITLAITLISILAFTTDLFQGRIYNWLTLPGILGGLIAVTILGSWSGLSNSLLGVTLALVLYGALFFFHVIGGGDVKFLMALAAWGGWHFTLEVAMLSVLLGGVMAAGVLIVKGRALDFAKRMRQFFLSILVKELEPEKPKIDMKSQMPFGIPMALAAVFLVWKGPLWFT